mgnify:CR=1 FL=1
MLAARQLAEEAAQKSLHTLGVDEADSPGHLDNEGRKLRVRLRAQARQLGDKENSTKKGCYEIKHLDEKIAYDQWHRLLFARFLAENDLLISPEHGVGASLSDCEEFAPMLGLRDGWEVASRFAARMLPQIFRADDPAGQVVFAPEDRVALRKLVTDLPREVFLADDALGWVYQFWQAQRKDEVNASECKIGADELAPVTQLFTEDYMVLFLLHNTLGAWWAAKNNTCLSGLQSEEECRKAVSLPGVDWEYLRFIRDEKTAGWRPAAGVFKGWPKLAKELRLLDPCMGSGHFVVAELPILVAMRMAEEKLSGEEAVDAVLRDNLHGLELDSRCTQIGAFNLALAAWKLLGAYRQLPPMNLACCGLGINARKEEWLKLAGEDKTLLYGMEQLFDLFKKGPELGSLINPRTVGGADEFLVKYSDLQPLLNHALERENAKKNPDPDARELGVTASGIAMATEILSSKFTLVATNVPYLGRGKQSEVLQEYCTSHHPDAKADLATCFVQRCLAFCCRGGISSLVVPQNWWFSASYKAFRKTILKDRTISFAATLGEEAWQSFGNRGPVAGLMGIGFDAAPLEHVFMGVDALPEKSINAKMSILRSGAITLLNQADQFDNSDHRISVYESSNAAVIGEYARSYQGIKTGDDERICRRIWEFPGKDSRWRYYQGSVSRTCLNGGMEMLIDWSGEGSELARKQGVGAWGKRGVIVCLMRALPATLYYGDAFSSSVSPIIVEDKNNMLATWTYCSSPVFSAEVKKIDRRVCVTNANIIKVPFNLAYWQKLADEKYPNGLPKPHSDDPTQWLFSGHPKGSEAPLQVAVARMLGYRWPRQTGSEFPDCPALGPDGLEPYSDDDGVVCLNAIHGERPAAERLRTLLASAFGRDWSEAKQAELLTQVGCAGKTLEHWLRNSFFEQHCQLFQQRPFIWQVWDGLKDGFSALILYHRLDRRLLEKVTFTYLGDWVARQKAAVAAGEEGSDAKLAAAVELKSALEKILEGEAPYDIFVRWKPLAKQPIGWEPDLNDGVRMNIRPFVEAGVLRKPPKIKWNKDRGTDVSSAPWYKVFHGERINDHHATLAEKRKVQGI